MGQFPTQGMKTRPDRTTEQGLGQFRCGVRLVVVTYYNSSYKTLLPEHLSSPLQKPRICKGSEELNQPCIRRN